MVDLTYQSVNPLLDPTAGQDVNDEDRTAIPEAHLSFYYSSLAAKQVTGGWSNDG